MNERIKELRKTLGLTLDKFGERIGVKKAAVSRWENGDNIADRMVLAICREFNVSEEWLRDGIGDMFIIPEDEDAALIAELIDNPDNEFYKSILRLVATYKQMSPTSQKVLEEFAQKYLENERENRQA